MTCVLDEDTYGTIFKLHSCSGRKKPMFLFIQSITDVVESIEKQGRFVRCGVSCKCGREQKKA